MALFGGSSINFGGGNVGGSSMGDLFNGSSINVPANFFGGSTVNMGMPYYGGGGYGFGAGFGYGGGHLMGGATSGNIPPMQAIGSYPYAMPSGGGGGGGGGGYRLPQMPDPVPDPVPWYTPGPNSSGYGQGLGGSPYLQSQPWGQQGNPNIAFNVNPGMAVVGGGAYGGFDPASAFNHSLGRVPQYDADGNVINDQAGTLGEGPIAANPYGSGGYPSGGDTGFGPLYNEGAEPLSSPFWGDSGIRESADF